MFTDYTRVGSNKQFSPKYICLKSDFPVAELETGFLVQVIHWENVCEQTTVSAEDLLQSDPPGEHILHHKVACLWHRS